MSIARNIDGLKQADAQFELIRAEIARHHLSPKLKILYVGSNSASESYIKHKKEKAAAVGIDAEVVSFPVTVDQQQVVAKIEELNRSKTVNGIIVQLPLPDGFGTGELLSRVDPTKDVDGLHPLNFGRLMGDGEPEFFPPTPVGIVLLLDNYEVEIPGANIVIVGMGRLVGKPLTQMLVNREATVLCLQERTANPSSLIRQGEVVITGVGVPNLINKSDISPGAVVIDAGISRQDGRLVGDVNYSEVRKVAGLITPVPGGVGPMTVACLLKNTVKACLIQNE